MADMKIDNKGNIGITNKGKLNIAQKNEVTKVINEGDYLSNEQKKTITELADKLAELKALNGKFGMLKPEDGTPETKKHNSGIRGRAIGSCRKTAINQCKEATSISSILAKDYKRTFNKLNQLITYEMSGENAHEHDDFQKDFIKKIQARRNQLKISDEKFRLYIKEQYGADSITALSYDDLKHLKSHTFGKNPSFVSKREDKNITEKRVAALADWLEYQKAINPDFDPNEKTFYKFEIFAALHERNPHLFDIEPPTFEKFWKLKQVVDIRPKIKTGSPRPELSEKYDRYILKKD